MHLQKVYEIWQGSLYDLDKALQLVLIIDHIADWGRTSYQPQIFALIDILVPSMRGNYILTDRDRVRDTPCPPSSISVRDEVITLSDSDDDEYHGGDDNDEADDDDDDQRSVKTEGNNDPRPNMDEISALGSMTINDHKVPKKTLPISYAILTVEQPTTILTKLSRFIHNSDSCIQFFEFCSKGANLSYMFWQIVDRSIILSGAELQALELHWLRNEVDSDSSFPETLKQTQFLVVILVRFDFNGGKPYRELKYFAFDLVYMEHISRLLSDNSERSSAQSTPSEKLGLEDLKRFITNLHQQSSRSILQACFLGKYTVLVRVAPITAFSSHFSSWNSIVYTTYGEDDILSKDIWYLHLLRGIRRLDIYGSPPSFWMLSYSKVSIIDTFREAAYPHPSENNETSSSFNQELAQYGGWVTDRETNLAESPPVLFLTRSYVPRIVLFRGAEYGVDFNFEDAMEREGSDKGSQDDGEGDATKDVGLQQLRDDFPGLTDAEICKALVD